MLVFFVYILKNKFTNMAVYFTYIDCIRILYFTCNSQIDTFVIIDESDNFDNITYEFSWSLDDSTWSIYMTKEDVLTNIYATNQFTDVQIYIRIRISLEKTKTLHQSYYELTSVLINDSELTPMSIEVPSSSNILNTSNSKNLFNPYRNFDNQKILYDKMSKSISDIFGFECIYFKTEPLIDSEDITFRSYRLSNVTEYKPLKVVINNNDLPDNKLRFSEYDIDFQDELELHIVKEVFAEQFGIAIPNANDFLYLPLTDRMYQINTIYEAKEFMNHATYYKTMLVKYENRSSVLKELDVTDKLDEYVEFEQDYKADKVSDELLDAVKAYNEVKQDDRQNTISTQELTIDNQEIIRWSYDYTNIDTVIASKFDTILKTNIYAIAFWFSVTDLTNYLFSLHQNAFELLHLRYDKDLHAFKLKLTDQSSMIINDTMLVTEQINTSEMYGFLLNYSETTMILTCTIINTKLEFVQELLISNIRLAKFDKILFYNQTTIANIRISKTTVSRQKILQELTNFLPEPSKYYIIDNAVPSIID